MQKLYIHLTGTLYFYILKIYAAKMKNYITINDVENWYIRQNVWKKLRCIFVVMVNSLGKETESWNDFEKDLGYYVETLKF